MNKRPCKINTAFTLIELLIVISLISMLSSVILSSLSNAREAAQIAKFIQEMDSLRKAILIYRSNHNDQPPPCPNPNAEPVGPISCLDSYGLTHYESALQPLIDEGYISKIPHFPRWPASSQIDGVSPYTYLYYLPSFYNYGPMGNGTSEYSCTPIDYNNWSPGHAAGTLLIWTTYTLPFTDGYTHCDSAGYCDNNYPRLVETEPPGRVYCLSLDY